MVRPVVDHSTRDLACIRLQLRDELIFIPQRHRGKHYYHIEVPSAMRFYRIGYAEYLFISLLDGKTSFAEALAVTAQRLGPTALSQTQALAVTSWMVENGLAYSLEDHATSSDATQSSTRHSGKLLQQLNPFWTKLPLCRPDRLISSILPVFGGLFSWPATCVAFLLGLVAIAKVGAHWDRFVGTSEIVFSPTNWIWMLAVWIVLKVIHEFAHGIACKRYGGEVREMGLMFILFAPMAYVDVTSSWKFSSKWQRIHVAAAGMYAELILAAIAALVWSETHSGFGAHLLYNVILMASLSTLVFNANPLMRFDGYFILSDLLEIPNLYSEAAASVRRLMGLVFYGKQAVEAESIGARSWFTGTYGVAAAIWRMVICVSLVLAASVLFRGAGLLLAVFGVACWFLQPSKRVLIDLIQRFHENRHSFVRAVLVSLLLGSTTVALLAILPSPGTVTAPGILDFNDRTMVRNTTAGFVEQIHVRDGQQVTKGELLLELRNDQLTSEYHELLSSIQQTQVEHRIALDSHRPADALVAQRNQQAFEERLAKKQTQMDGLSVRAPAAGRVVARQMEQRIATYLHEGTELARIGTDQQKEFVISIDQDDVHAVVTRIGAPVHVRVGSRRRVPGTLSRVEPRASLAVPHSGLAATEGGPLTVTESEEASQNESTVALTEPRFRGIVTLPTSSAKSLYCGERGYVVIGWRPESLGSQLKIWLDHWFRHKLHSLRAQ